MLDRCTLLALSHNHQGHKLLLGISFELCSWRPEAIEVGIKSAGGVVVGYKKQGGDEMLRKSLGRLEVEVVVTRYHHGVVYLKVCGISSFLYHHPGC